MQSDETVEDRSPNQFEDINDFALKRIYVQTKFVVLWCSMF